MSDTKIEGKKSNGAAPAPRIRRTFGLDGDALIDRLEKQRVSVTTSTGEVIVGVLIGATPYTVTLLVDNVPTIINKGAMVTLRPATNGAKDSDNVSVRAE